VNHPPSTPVGALVTEREVGVVLCGVAGVAADAEALPEACA